MSRRKIEHVLVLGAGNFGTVLAQHLALEGHEVTLWARSSDVASAINENHKNPKYLNTVTLSSRIRATSDLDPETARVHTAILYAAPTQSMREILSKVRGGVDDTKLFINAAKGIEVGSLELPQQIIKDLFGESIAEHSVMMSGPSFASELVERSPTAVSMASLSKQRGLWAQEMFHAPHFRVYQSFDPTGLEVAGALKNVIAIAAGAAVGLGYGMNTRATLITRGLAEITRVGVALGANPLTFTGLGGVGDLFLTCSSDKSRNFTVGYRLGKGESLDHILKTMGSVAEGVTTAKAARELADKLKVHTPIIHEVYQVLFDAKPMAKAVLDLMTREAKEEIDLGLDL